MFKQILNNLLMGCNKPGMWIAVSLYSLRQLFSGNTRNWLLTRWSVDGINDHFIRMCKSMTKFIHQQMGSRISLWLKHNSNRPIESFRRKQSCFDFGWMMGIIIHNKNIIYFPNNLKSAFGSLERIQCI